MKATTSLTMYLSPALMPFAGIIGSGQVVRPTATKKKNKNSMNYVFTIIYFIVAFFYVYVNVHALPPAQVMCFGQMS